MSAFSNLQITPNAIEVVTVPFGEWTPDLLPLNNAGAFEALNVIAANQSYVPYKSLSTDLGLSTPEMVRGAISVENSLGNLQLYAGTTLGLYRRVDITFVNAFTSPIFLLDTFLWQFVQFGSYVVALHPQLTPQFVDASTTNSFTTVGGSPPIAKCGARVGDFLVLGNTVEADGAHMYRVRWGGFNRIDAPWTTDPATQADFQDMPSEGGGVIGVVGLTDGIVFQEKCISRMRYVGLPTVFDITLAEQGRGAISVASIVNAGEQSYGSQIYYIANDGFFVWNGFNSSPISSNKVTRYFFSRLNYGARGRIVGAWDSKNECVRWAFPVGSSTDITEVIIYSYAQQRWTHAFDNLEYMLSDSLLEISLDSLGGDLDTDYPLSFDDPAMNEGKPELAGFDTTHTYGSFNGAALAATIDTGDASGPKGSRIFVDSVRPLADNFEKLISVRVGKRDQFIGDTLEYSAPVRQELTGECSIWDDARYMRFRVEIPAGTTWNFAAGVDVWRKATGRV